MKRWLNRRTVWQWVLFGSAFVNLSVGQTTVPVPAITVRLDSLGSTRQREVAEIKQSANAIFRHAGIFIFWIDCWKAPTTCASLDRTGVIGEPLVRVRIVDHLDRADVHTLGWTAMGSMATTIQYRRAQQIAHASTLGVSVGQILGHVAAHEIGHVLLGSSTHDSFGVMSATFGNRDLVSMAQGRLLFTAEEARLLRARLSRETLDSGTRKADAAQNSRVEQVAILNSKNLQCTRLNQ